MSRRLPFILPRRNGWGSGADMLTASLPSCPNYDECKCRVYGIGDCEAVLAKE